MTHLYGGPRRQYASASKTSRSAPAHDRNDSDASSDSYVDAYDSDEFVVASDQVEEEEEESEDDTQPPHSFRDEVKEDDRSTRSLGATSSRPKLLVIENDDESSEGIRLNVLSDSHGAPTRHFRSPQAKPAIVRRKSTRRMMRQKTWLVGVRDMFARGERASMMTGKL